MKIFFAFLASATLITGCAIPNTTYSSARSIEVNPTEKFQVFGAYKSSIVGAVTWNDDDICNDKAFINYIRLENKAQNVIEIIMSETCIGQGQGAQCKCSYSGIGVNYTTINVEEAKAWNMAVSPQMGNNDPKGLDITITSKNEGQVANPAVGTLLPTNAAAQPALQTNQVVTNPAVSTIPPQLQETGNVKYPEHR